MTQQRSCTPGLRNPNKLATYGLVLGLPHLEGPGCFGLPGCWDCDGQYCDWAALVLLDAALNPPEAAITPVPPPISPSTSVTATTRLDPTSPFLFCGREAEAPCEACAIARSLIRSSSRALASGRCLRSCSTTPRRLIGTGGSSFEWAIYPLNERGGRFLTGRSLSDA
jgi:hypothetical protein